MLTCTKTISCSAYTAIRHFAPWECETQGAGMKEKWKPPWRGQHQIRGVMKVTEERDLITNGSIEHIRKTL